MRFSLFRFLVTTVIALGIFSVTNIVAQNARISKEAAKKIALKLHPGKIKSAELETEHGVKKYSFDIQTKEGIREVGIDAASGKVVEDSLESGADEAQGEDADRSKKD